LHKNILLYCVAHYEKGSGDGGILFMMFKNNKIDKIPAMHTPLPREHP
jgi:hypothetical protein